MRSGSTRPLERLLGWIVCPYEDRDCPKVSDLEKTVEDNSTRLANVERLLYIIIGMLAVEFGVMLI